MIKIKWFNKDEEKPTISIKVEGSIEVKTPSYNSYEEYVKKEKKEALKKEVEKYVDNLLCNPYSCSGYYPYFSKEERGFNKAKASLVEIIMEEIEID